MARKRGDGNAVLHIEASHLWRAREATRTMLDAQCRVQKHTGTPLCPSFEGLYLLTANRVQQRVEENPALKVLRRPASEVDG